MVAFSNKVPGCRAGPLSGPAGNGGKVFKKPLRRDPLVVGWVLVLIVAAFVALDDNTTWHGHLDPARVAGFLKELADAFLWSFFALLALAWLRARLWGSPGRLRAKKARPAAGTERFDALPWTDRWLRDWREEAAERPAESKPDPLQALTCRHGVPVSVTGAADQAPILRALSVSSFIVPRGGRVSVSWCFEQCRSVVVDGRGGYPACGEATVTVDASRRIEVVGHNRHGSTPVATACVVATDVPQLDLPTAVAPPPVVLRTDVAATVGPAAPVSRRLDEFWAAHDRVNPNPTGLAAGPPARLVGVPASVIDRLRRVRHIDEESLL